MFEKLRKEVRLEMSKMPDPSGPDAPLDTPLTHLERVRS